MKKQNRAALLIALAVVFFMGLNVFLLTHSVVKPSSGALDEVKSEITTVIPDAKFKGFSINSSTHNGVSSTVIKVKFTTEKTFEEMQEIVDSEVLNGSLAYYDNNLYEYTVVKAK
jgi:hypothetical protein